MTRIPRSDRYEAQLTEAEAKPLFAALLSGDERIEDIRKTAPPWRTGPWAGQLPGLSTLSSLRERLSLDQTVAENDALSETLKNVLGDSLPGITPDQLDTIGHKTFAALAIRRQDARTFIRLSTSRNRVELERRRLAQRDAVLDIARQKFRRDTCELFLKWHEDRRATEIANSNGCNAAKIEALGRIMFGNDWRDENPPHPAGYYLGDEPPKSGLPIL